jgi:hypothetical protein
LREIAEANESSTVPHHVAILCDQDPLELMRQIDSNFRDHLESPSGSTRRFCHPDKWVTIRRGLGHHTADLLILAAVNSAAGVIVLHEEELDDSQVVRCALAISAALCSRGADSLVPKQDLPVVTFNSSSALAHLLDHRLSTIAASYHADNCWHVSFIPLSPDEIRIGIETQVAHHRGLSYVYQFFGDQIRVTDRHRKLSKPVFSVLTCRTTERGRIATLTLRSAKTSDSVGVLLNAHAADCTSNHQLLNL